MPVLQLSDFSALVPNQVVDLNGRQRFDVTPDLCDPLQHLFDGNVVGTELALSRPVQCRDGLRIHCALLDWACLKEDGSNAQGL
jgi:hypothetical protein